MTEQDKHVDLEVARETTDPASAPAESLKTKTNGTAGDGESAEFVPLFSEGLAEDMLKENTKLLEIIELREKRIKKVLGDLIDVVEVIKKRNRELNEKEATLNQEYLKLMEIENMYKGVDRIAHSLSDVMPAITGGAGEEKRTQTEEDDNNNE